MKQIKLVQLGQSGTGKTSLVLRFTKGYFHENLEPTVGAQFSTQTVKTSTAYSAMKVNMDDCTVRFEIWDTAGQERYNALAPMYYRGAHVALIVYDITDMASFKIAKAWIDEVQKRASAEIVIALVGNKKDIADRRMVEYQDGKQLAEERDLLFVETSAKTGENINDLFLALAEKVSSMSLAEEDTQVLNKDNDVKERRRCCK